MPDYTVKTRNVENGSEIRTAIILDPISSIGSVVVLAPDGSELCLLNICFSDETQWFNVDVIDRKGEWEKKRLLAFLNGGMVVNSDISSSSLGAVEFSGRKE